MRLLYASGLLWICLDPPCDKIIDMFDELLACEMTESFIIMMRLRFYNDRFKRIVRKIFAIAVRTTCEVLETWSLRSMHGRGWVSFRLSEDRFPKCRGKRMKRREFASHHSVK